MKRESGNILLYLLLVMALLGMLAMAISSSSTNQSDIVVGQTRDDQINRLSTYVTTLGGAIQQMVVKGENPNTLSSSISVLKPGDAGFETSPHNLKIFHPLGGGISYLSASAQGGTPIATNYLINPGASIEGVGCTAGSSSTGTNYLGQTVTTGACTTDTGHIVFVATIATEADCKRINQILNNTTSVPTMDGTAFTALITNGTTVAITAANCAACVGVARQCVSNGSSAWGFYADLFPPQWMSNLN